MVLKRRIRLRDPEPPTGEHEGDTALGTTGTQTVEVELGGFYVEPASIEVPAGTELSLTITNAGEMPHDLKLEGTSCAELIDPGETATAELGVTDASAQAWCTVPGHKAAGMVLDITVTGTASDASGQAGDGANDATDDAAVIDFEAEPAQDWRPYDPMLRPAPGGTEHKLTLHAVETEIEVAPGVTQTMWNFDGPVPGTTLRGRVGDLFTLTLVNDGTIGHSIDFHASKVAWNDEMRTIEPGESLVYQFEAKHAGAFMYHCGTQPAFHHIGNGMVGAIVIDPPNLAAVDHEYLFVSPSSTSGPRASLGTSPRCRMRPGTPWSSTATSTSTATHPSASSRVSGCGPGWSTPAPRRTRRSTWWAPCSTSCSRKAPISCVPVPAVVVPRRLTFSLPRAASSSSPSTNPASTPS
jgi:nitrite reductase (NO-forming)